MNKYVFIAAVSFVSAVLACSLVDAVGQILRNLDEGEKSSLVGGYQDFTGLQWTENSCCVVQTECRRPKKGLCDDWGKTPCKKDAKAKDYVRTKNNPNVCSPTGTFPGAGCGESPANGASVSCLQSYGCRYDELLKKCVRDRNSKADDEEFAPQYCISACDEVA